MEINKRELFKKAHQLAKTMEGNYRACFTLALIKLYKQARQLKLRKVVDDKFLISTATVGKQWYLELTARQIFLIMLTQYLNTEQIASKKL